MAHSSAESKHRRGPPARPHSAVPWVSFLRLVDWSPRRLGPSRPVAKSSSAPCRGLHPATEQAATISRFPDFPRHFPRPVVESRTVAPPVPPHWQPATLEPATLPHWQHSPKRFRKSFENRERFARELRLWGVKGPRPARRRHCPPTPIATIVHQNKCQSQSKFRPALPPICIVIDDSADWWTLRVGGQSLHPIPLVPTVPQPNNRP